MMKNNDEVKTDGFTLISILQKELSKNFPQIFQETVSKCNKILTELSQEFSHENSDIIEIELSISSKNNLIYLENLVNSQLYWNDEEIDNLQKGHYNFLKEEYFSIIKHHYLPDKIPIIYSDNYNILTEQKKNDSQNINQIFDDFKKKIELKKQERLIKLEEGTNYMIKERENEREIKVRVEINGDIEKLIPPDS